MACIATLMRLVCSPFARARSKSCSQLCVRVTAPAAAARTTRTKHCSENAKSRAEMTIGASTRVGCGAHYPAAWRMHGPRTHPWPICAGTPLLSPVVVVSWLSRRSEAPRRRSDTLPRPPIRCGPRPFSRPRAVRCRFVCGLPAHFYTLLRPPALSPPCCTQRQWCARTRPRFLAAGCERLLDAIGRVGASAWACG